MDDEHRAAEFERHRSTVRAVGYRLLGSLADADDVVQEAWLRYSTADADAIDNLGGWLTTVVTRLSLNVLRTRRRRREEPWEVTVPDPVVMPLDAARSGGLDPEQEVLLADAVGLAFQVVLDSLAPPERVAFVLHDLFDVDYEEIGRMLERSQPATRQLASRARRRVRDAGPPEDPDPVANRAVVSAFFRAAGQGDLAGLIALLDPDVVLRSDGGPRRPNASAHVRGAGAVASRALLFADPTARVRPVQVNGGSGVVVMRGDVCVAVMGMRVAAGRIVEITALADLDRLRSLDLSWV